ncbi:DNA integrity scanning diadenylate cyclase DisA [Aestuariimicrobium ganziense]|uniref:DNA integrity scanning diadenylate cyclase DisA n=1 Tax=Aestuariimicrobium ganziense TaxID=2773677 RepID=UPI002E29EC20|nr:DNA integrity scanning diadenylate cyclase DisA [Aestuariimicrobium ganziense]
MPHDHDHLARLRRYQALLAPGTAMRDGLERIVHGRTGALIVLGNTKAVQQVSSGGFTLDVDFTPTALRELSKLDGGIVLSSDLRRIVQAGVHFVPDGTLPTVETGTRHRSADRVAQQTGLPVVTVSASMSTIALFLEGDRYQVERPEQLLSRANQALATLVSYGSRVVELTAALNGLEVADQVTLRDVALLVQRIEMMRRLEVEIDDYVTKLGTDGRLLQMQLMEHSLGLEELALELAVDYRPADADELAFGLHRLDELSAHELFDVLDVAQAFGFPASDHLETRLVSRGYRQLASIPRLPLSLGQRLLEHFGSIQALFSASVAELREVEGIGDQRARSIREGLLRLAEQALTR